MEPICVPPFSSAAPRSAPSSGLGAGFLALLCYSRSPEEMGPANGGFFFRVRGG